MDKMGDHMKYTFNDFINQLATYSETFKSQACISENVIDIINEALPKKYKIVKIEG